MPKVKLVYFDARGLAEASRLILHYAKVDFEDVRIQHADWPALKPKTKTGKIPYLEFDGHLIVESYAMHRFLARKYGLAGKDEFEQALVDGIADVSKDFYAAVAPWMYAVMGFREGNPEELKKPHLYDNLEEYLPIFSTFLKESKSGFLAPSGLTWADFVFSELIITLVGLESNVLDKHPEIKEYIEKIKNLPELKEYYSTRKQ
uniref:Glutathione S-transferase n=1 Tax=Panagrolaimus sp. ES5 TaxID=591445 RepID=A0AC34FAU5_9BILA